ncbi:hypothetical protein KSP40_PGU021459 [Platanthera guangdongensis]|uniref:B-like cyclin n=1 Tax=Platanthera guangdongensis TaxID=2320717 RepID=A0ABR2LN92_9ASPA
MPVKLARSPRSEWVDRRGAEAADRFCRSRAVFPCVVGSHTRIVREIARATALQQRERKNLSQMECMTFFFAELALMHYSMVMYCPSMVAASAVYAAHCTLNKTPPWTKTLQYHTGFSEPQLRFFSLEIVISYVLASFQEASSQVPIQSTWAAERKVCIDSR